MIVGRTEEGAPQLGTGTVVQPETPAVDLGKLSTQELLDTITPAVPAVQAPVSLTPEAGAPPLVSDDTLGNIGTTMKDAGMSALKYLNDPFAALNAPRAIAGAVGNSPELGQGAQAQPMIPKDPAIAPAGNQPPMPPPGGGSASMAASMKTGGGGASRGPSSVDDGLRRAVDREVAANNANAEVESARLNAQAKLQQQELDQQQALELKRQQNEVLLAQRQEELAQKQMATADQMQQMSSNIDPNRWLNSRTPAQKFLMVLASALSGGEAMKTFQSAIDQDIMAQQKSYESGSDKLRAAQGARQSAYGMFRDAGLDARQSHLAASQFVTNQFKRQAEMLASTSSSETIINNAKAFSAQADQKYIKDEQGLKLARSADSLAWLKERNDQAAREQELQLKMIAAGAKGGKLEELKPPQMEMLEKDKQRIDALTDLQKKFKETKGASAFLDKLKAHVPGTDAAKYNLARNEFIQSLMRLSQSDAPSAAEFKFYEDSLAQAGDLQGEEKFIAALERATRDANSRIATYKAGGYNTQGIEAARAVDPNFKAPLKSFSTKE